MYYVHMNNSVVSVLLTVGNCTFAFKFICAQNKMYNHVVKKPCIYILCIICIWIILNIAFFNKCVIFTIQPSNREIMDVHMNN